MVHSRRTPSCTLFFLCRSPQHNNLTDLTTEEQPTTQLDMHSATTQPATQPPNVLPVHDPAYRTSSSLAILEIEDGVSKFGYPLSHQTSLSMLVTDRPLSQNVVALSLFSDGW
jgi:hypothetical protein